MKKLAATQFHWRWRRWTFPLQAMLPEAKDGEPDTLPEPYRNETMANLQAAVAWSLMQTLDENLAARRARVDAYRKLLGREPGLELIPHRGGSACLTQVVRIRAKRRGQDLPSALIATLRSRGYEIQGSYVPIHLLARFKQCVWDSLPRTERTWGDLIELPCEPSVSISDAERISTLILHFIDANAASFHRHNQARRSTMSDGVC